MEYWNFLLYKRMGVLRRAREYKKRHGPFVRTRAAGISHRRGSWLACRREMLLKRQKCWPRSIAAEASEILVKFYKSAVRIHEWLLDGVRAGFTGSNA